MRDVVDRWRTSGARGAAVFFDMLTGLRPVRNVLGVSDPDVHKLDGRWVMFLGGMTNRLKVQLFTATLPIGAPLSSGEWSLVTDPKRPTRAVPVVPLPPKGEWDSRGMHTPSYVRGRQPDGTTEERIYYAGHSARAVTGNRSRYSIGYLRRTATGWSRYGPPVHAGTPERPSVLEPLVRYDEGLWRMWYLSAPHEVGPGEMPDYQLEYVESPDGIHWGTPEIMFTTVDGFFDNAVIAVDGHYEMVVARGTNLHGTPNFPEQGLWWLRSPKPSGRRSDWTDHPVRLLNSEVEPLPWFANGGCGPAFHYGDTEADRDTMYIFFTGTRRKINWFAHAVRRLLRGRRPPVPSPFHLATGRIEIPGMRVGDRPEQIGVPADRRE
ncbi:hypothetical protein FB566_4132 [Stackebrandtia endophytica]|uniref:Uncharacterized protein n=1 Tax=Stackebrandtia endophytica TaxID=1496996 RepID=A0A543B137_9ACTN|nr:hypothetical protein [Stackebrandtia endophytica]TQL78543.1 hypothetical protein FB566_4132 [Stackebrandtia endophytica]